MIAVAILNRSTLLTDEQVRPVAAALQQQAARDYAPAWDSEVPTVGFVDQAPAGAIWQLVLLDDTDQAGDLGYHELTASGLPLGRVFVRTDQQCGLNWTITASHELIEMLGDPDLDRLTSCTAGGQDMQTALELCDPVEDDQFGYAIDGVMVSDFVLPSYYRPSGAAPFDFCNHLTAGVPAMLSGGYLAVQPAAGGAWSQIYGQRSPADRARLPRPRGRLDRRRLPRTHWRHSAA